MLVHPLNVDDPFSLILVADQRFSTTSPENDNVWELHFENHAPIALETTFGLRACHMRIFHQITVSGQIINHPAQYFSKPVIDKIFPNYLSIFGWLITNISIRNDFLIRNNNLITGRIQFSNYSPIDQRVKFDIAAVLKPLNAGYSMKPTIHNLLPVLQGQTETLIVSMVMSGGPMTQGSPFPSLTTDLILPPNEQVNIVWSCTVDSDKIAGIEGARKALNFNWDAEVARVEMVNQANSISIKTGDPKWDAVFHLSQTAAFSLLHTPDDTDQPPRPTPYRNSESIHPKGINTSLRNDDLSILQLYHLSQVLLPANAGLVKKLLSNSLSKRSTHFKENFSTPKMPLFPLIAQLAFQIYEIDFDLDFLRQVYPVLVQNLLTWFNTDQDVDQDGVPECSSASNIGLTFNTLADPIHTSGEQINPAFLESPALAALIIAEYSALKQIERILNEINPAQELDKLLRKTKTGLGKMYQTKNKCFNYRDRDSHESPNAEILFSSKCIPKIAINKTLLETKRLHIILEFEDNPAQPFSLIICGIDATGQDVLEEFNFRQLFLINDKLSITSKNLYSQLLKIEILGITPLGHLKVQTLGLEQLDISCLAPVLTDLMTEKRLSALIDHNILLDHPAYQYGIPENIPTKDQLWKETPNAINFPWNHLILLGLRKHHQNQLSYTLFSRLMSLCVQTLENHHAFFENYNPVSGNPIGYRNALSGLIPITFFLDLVGIKIYSPKKIRISGENPFPWPVTIHFCGLEVHRAGRNTKVTLANGQTIHHYGTAAKLFEAR